MFQVRHTTTQSISERKGNVIIKISSYMPNSPYKIKMESSGQIKSIVNIHHVLAP